MQAHTNVIANDLLTIQSEASYARRLLSFSTSTSFIVKDAPQKVVILPSLAAGIGGFTHED